MNEEMAYNKILRWTNKALITDLGNEIVCSDPTGVMIVCSECCVFSGRGLCDVRFTRP
jgi:hypothetical protein